ncbi:hypothetical protein B0H16DRAFT_1458832 [Mycena metata]|uniref:Uncharacterized protein n=1 Tax=Mycena metata TaxID=1033252 RepID=A0AAD7J595_9AGAR|nr:hypothetical protein B0H16DRAFT_1458832 [Mycena metata]
MHNGGFVGLKREIGSSFNGFDCAVTFWHVNVSVGATRLSGTLTTHPILRILVPRRPKLWPYESRLERLNFNAVPFIQEGVTMQLTIMLGLSNRVVQPSTLPQMIIPQLDITFIPIWTRCVRVLLVFDRTLTRRIS